MPLVVPGINSGGDNSKTEEWMNKLVGKKLTDGTSDSTVGYACSSDEVNADEVQSFAKQDLPKETRVIEPGMMVTKDFKPER